MKRLSHRSARAHGVRGAMLALVALLSGCASAAPGARTETPGSEPFAEVLAASEAREGLLTFHADARKGKVWLELPPFETGANGLVGEYLYVEGLVTGLGSNPVGLDRGQLGPARLVRLRRLGGRLLVEEPNLAFRALSDDPAERRATRESFADSVLWAGRIEEETDDGRALVDFTSFLLRDAHGVVRTLNRSGQGSYRLDVERSAVDFENCLAFPDNLEFESLLTFVADEPGSLVAQTAPNGEAFGLVLHQSLVRLPGAGYRPRHFDPRAASFAISFQDYAVPLDQPIETRWIVRHRLSSTGPDSELVYYVDSGVPEPVRSALVEGASWWADAFAAAGFPGAYRVEILPEGIHPLDIRYNVIQWVHRSTRGWSYGGGVIDPRTGEMIKGHVNLGSLRVRQDRLLFEGLLGTAKTGSGADDDPIELALARIRQLSAHEVGHTLGFAHNFAASSYGRESVMDYPAPLVRVGASGSLDVSEAYAVGAGAWDVHSVRYAYTEFPNEASEAGGLEAIVQEGRAAGLLFSSDRDARPAGAAVAASSLWDNGSDAVEQLVEELAVRRIALDHFGLDNIADGTPVALLEEVLATVYFRHRYQLEAAVKAVGGMEYSYAVKGDGTEGVRPVSAERQRRGLEVVLTALAAETLDLPESVLELLAPRPFGHLPNRELFSHRTAPAFDALGAAETAADMVVRSLLQPERAARLVEFWRRDQGLPSFDEVLDRLIAAGFDGEEAESPRLRSIRQAVQGVIVYRLIDLASDPDAALSVRAAAESSLRRLSGRLAPNDDSHETLLQTTIERFLARSQSAPARAQVAPEIPPGSPIGTAGGGDCSWAQSTPTPNWGGSR